MKLSFTHILVAAGIMLPFAFFLSGMKEWAAGAVVGEILGFINYIWIGLTVKKVLSKADGRFNRILIMHSLSRYLLMGLAIFVALKTPEINVWGLVLGYTVIQMPAAIIRALATANRS